MAIYNCWYDNGTGYYEGSYIEEHEDYDSAYRSTNVGYGAYISETGEDPNFTETKIKNYVGWKELHEKYLSG